ncbi:MAG: substrate-binding domain-containing protein, partial [Ostreibacterium sp.]
MYTKKRLGLIFISSLFLVNVGAAEASKDLVAIYKSGTQQYFIDQAEGFVKAAKVKGYNARIINVELDANKAISAIDDAIASGAAGIAITAPDQGIGPTIAAIAAKSRVLLIATDDPLKTKNGEPVPFVGFDGTAMGTSVGKAAANLLKKSGWMKGNDYGILATEYQTVSVCNDRTNAARVQLEKLGVPKNKFHTVVYDGTTNNALTAAGPVITANPKVNKW